MTLQWMSRARTTSTRRAPSATSSRACACRTATSRCWWRKILRSPVSASSIARTLDSALPGHRKIFLATQHDASVDEPSADDIYETGTIGNIVQSVRMPDGNIKVLVEGVERARSIEVNDDDGFFVATVRTGKTQLDMTPQVEQLMHRVHALFEQYVKLQQSLNHETVAASVRMDEPAKLADTSAANLQLGR